MTPDKIYLDKSKITENGFILDAIVPDGRVEASDVCYIRKDALLEWAKKKVQRIDTGEGDYSLGYVSAIIDLIDKLN